VGGRLWAAPTSYKLLKTAAVQANASIVAFQVDFRHPGLHPLSDHKVRGAALLPGVAMLELVSTAASILTGEMLPPSTTLTRPNRTLPGAGRTTVCVCTHMCVSER
jgi:hypothetical protein